MERPIPPYPMALKVLSPKVRVWADVFDFWELRFEESGDVLLRVNAAPGWTFYTPSISFLRL